MKKLYETERLLLHLFSENDADFLLKLYNSPNFIKYIGDRNIRTKEDAIAYYKNRFLPQIERLGFGNYVVILKETHQKIGAIGIFEREGLEVLDIGFSFLPAFEGKGFGFEAASKLIEIAPKDFGLKKISAITSKENISSQKLIQKMGLQFQKMVKIPNDDQDLLYYEISFD